MVYLVSMSDLRLLFPSQDGDKDLSAAQLDGKKLSTLAVPHRSCLTHVTRMHWITASHFMTYARTQFEVRRFAPADAH
jgi:hypothetical protein